MLITKKIVAEKIAAYLHHDITLAHAEVCSAGSALPNSVLH